MLNTYVALIAEKEASNKEIKDGANENLDFKAAARPNGITELLAACLERGRVAFDIDWEAYEILAIADETTGDLVFRSTRYDAIGYL